MILNTRVGGGIRKEDINAELLQSLDPDFKADNIAEGVDMFGLIGTFAGGVKMATGTVTATKTQIESLRYRYSASVGGLSFKPSHVMLVSARHSTNKAYYAMGIYDTYSIGYDGTYTISATFSENGFEVYLDSGMTGKGTPEGTYYWVAWSV